ncbi:MAG: hypothetical protein ACYC4L_00715 [Chloroflexota bacterium]
MAGWIPEAPSNEPTGSWRDALAAASIVGAALALFLAWEGNLLGFVALLELGLLSALLRDTLGLRTRLRRLPASALSAAVLISLAPWVIAAAAYRPAAGPVAVATAAPTVPAVAQAPYRLEATQTPVSSATPRPRTETGATVATEEQAAPTLTPPPAPTATSVVAPAAPRLAQAAPAARGSGNTTARPVTAATPLPEPERGGVPAPNATTAPPAPASTPVAETPPAPTPVPATPAPVPPTAVAPTQVPSTQVPPTATPGKPAPATPTRLPATPTKAPASPTKTPATAVPPTATKPPATPVPATPVPATPAPTPTPRPGVWLANIDLPLKSPPATTVWFTANTAPGADCQIEVFYRVGKDGKVEKKEQGLESQKADARGKIKWSWKPNFGLGSARVVVTVQSHGERLTREFTITIDK